MYNFLPCEEMSKLRKYLDEKKIEWEDNSSELICRTRYQYGNCVFSVVNGCGTYGGYYAYDASDNQNLLECMIMPFGVIDEDPEGWLTADDIIARMEVEE